MFQASVLLLRFAMVAMLNSMMPADAVSADSHIMALWLGLFAIIDAVAAALLVMAGARLILPSILYASAVWCALLALEQIFLRSTLLGYDDAVQMILLAALFAGIGTELVRCRRLKRRLSSSP